MHQELVENRRWISERRFLHALNYCMVLPGPEAQQLATYIGWLMHRTKGGVAAGVLFVLPSLLILMALSWVYLAWGELPIVAGLFDGIKPAVTAIVVQAAHRIGSRALKNGWLWGIAAASFVAIFAFSVPFPAIVAVAALIGFVGGRWAPDVFKAGAGHGKVNKSAGLVPCQGSNAACSLALKPDGVVASRRHSPSYDSSSRLASGLDGGAIKRHLSPDTTLALIDDDTPTPEHAKFRWARLAQVVAVGAVLWTVPMGLLTALCGWDHIFTQMAWFFTKAALLTFGGAYAVLPYVYQGAVVHYGWLTSTQMIDGLALGETTPGPLIMVVAFVGFVGGYVKAALGPGALPLAGVVAASLVTWFTFLPSFVFILAGGPLVESTHGDLQFTAPLTAITAAVVGVILSLALFFGYHVLWPQGLTGAFDGLSALIAAGAAVALFYFKRKVTHVIAACATLGLILKVVVL